MAANALPTPSVHHPGRDVKATKRPAQFGQKRGARSGTIASSAVPSEKMKNAVLALIKRKGTITCILDMGDDHEVSFFCAQFYRKTTPYGPPRTCPPSRVQTAAIQAQGPKEVRPLPRCPGWSAWPLASSCTLRGLPRPRFSSDSGSLTPAPTSAFGGVAPGLRPHPAAFFADPAASSCCARVRSSSTLVGSAAGSCSTSSPVYLPDRLL